MDPALRESIALNKRLMAAEGLPELEQLVRDEQTKLNSVRAGCGCAARCRAVCPGTQR